MKIRLAQDNELEKLTRLSKDAFDTDIHVGGTMAQLLDQRFMYFQEMIISMKLHNTKRSVKTSIIVIRNTYVHKKLNVG